MSTPRPEVFISATSADLRTCRQIAKEALLTLGCVPVEQTNFPPAASTVREMLRTRIAQCSAVVHIAGECYGAEPTERTEGEPRHSYTQLEYEIARELKKQVFVFVCGADFPYDEHALEPEELRALQAEHRRRLQAGDYLFTPVGNRDELALRVHALQTRVEQLGKELRRSRKWIGWGIAVGLVVAVVLGVWQWQSSVRAEDIVVRLGKVESELDRQRRYIDAVAQAFTEQQAQLAKLKLTDDELWTRAIAYVAEREKMAPETLRRGLDLFVAAIKADPRADYLDRARVEFAEKRFAASAESAGQSAAAYEYKLRAAEKLAELANTQAAEARDGLYQARTQQGRAYMAGRQFAKAAELYRQVTQVFTRATEPTRWAGFQILLGNAEQELADVSTGAEIARHRQEAVKAYRLALEVRTREALPQGWATTQNNLANALSDQAGASEGAERARLLGEAVKAYRLALEVRTREALPQYWAETQHNLACALRAQAAASEGTERARLLAESAEIEAQVKEAQSSTPR